LRVIDFRDPSHPKEVARWEAQQTDAGRYLHDVMVVDGLAYLAYWNDGLINLDVGNGMKGGSPENPQLVSQLKYDLNATYARVEQLWGTGFVRGTRSEEHTSELQSQSNLVCRLLLEKKKKETILAQRAHSTNVR